MVVLVSLSLPASAADRLTWLAAQEDEHRAEIDAAWEVQGQAKVARRRFSSSP